VGSLFLCKNSGTIGDAVWDAEIDRSRENVDAAMGRGTSGVSGRLCLRILYRTLRRYINAVLLLLLL